MTRALVWLDLDVHAQCIPSPCGAPVLFPSPPRTVFPGGRFFTYVVGERLRVLFTRPLDRTGVTLKVQASSDLVAWDDLAVSVNSAAFNGAGFVSENRVHPLTEPGLVEVRNTMNASAATRRQADQGDAGAVRRAHRNESGKQIAAENFCNSCDEMPNHP